jgi:hypothetical protein
MKNAEGRVQNAEVRIAVLFCILHSAFCIAAQAQIVAPTSRGIVVAHAGVVELSGGWKAAGVQTPGALVTSKERIAVLDPLANEARIVELATGRGTTVRTGETPIAGVFIGSALYILERDARALERIGADGARASINIAADPAFLRERDGMLYVYARAEGVVQEVGTSPFAVRRTAKTAPFGSDFEVDGRNAYVVRPRAGEIAVVNLQTMKPAATIEAGAVPVDVDVTARGTALTARTLAVADPASKKVWMLEGSQSTAEAFARGFLRGLLGLGLFGGRASQFKTGVDRVFLLGSAWYAYDSSSGTLYRFTKRSSTVVAKNLAPQGFAVTRDGVFVWNDAVRRLQKIAVDG